MEYTNLECKKCGYKYDIYIKDVKNDDGLCADCSDRQYITNHKVGDRVTSTSTLMLDRGFRGVTGVIQSFEKDSVDSWQYIIELDDGRTLQCDDSHLE